MPPTLSPEERTHLLALLTAPQTGLAAPWQRVGFLEAAGLGAVLAHLPPVETTPLMEWGQALVLLVERWGSLPETGQPSLATLLRALRERVGGDEAAGAFLTRLLGRYPSGTLGEAIGHHLGQRWLVGLGAILDPYYVGLGAEEAALRLPPRIGAWLGDELAERAGLFQLEGLVCRDPQGGSEGVSDVRAALLTLERAVLLGEPGSGKSWTLLRLALDLAAIWRGEQVDPVAGRAARVPLLVRLNEFRGEQSFAAWLEGQAGGLAPFLAELRQRGQLMLLLDALNEMPRRGPGGRDLVGEVRAHLAGEGAFILSCRVKDYRDDLAALHPLAHLTLKDLTPPQIRELVGRRLGEEEGAALWEAMGGSAALLGFWAKCAAKGEEARFWEARAGVPGYTSGEEDQAWRAMHAGARLVPLCRNPLTARLLADLYQGGEGTLPTSRATLFEGVVGQMLDREAAQAGARGEGWPGHERVERGLEGIARAMQEVGGTVLGREAAQAAAGDAGLVEAALGAGILVATGEEVRFFHQTMQEYFAARTLVAALEAGEDPARLFGEAWWEAGIWRETVVILGEVLGEGARGANRAARWLALASPEVALACLLEHGEGLGVAELEPATRAAVLASAEGKQGEAHPYGRAAAWRVLGRLGEDKRRGVGVRADGVPDIEWVELAGGKFPVGGDEEAYYSLPTQEVALPTFWMAKYPVTNWQWETFLRAWDGYEQEKWWVGLAGGKQEPREPGWGYGNHPRERVNWWEAMAFCRWLTEKLRGELPAGWVVRLPTEQEWERAARGQEGRAYPWGEAYHSGYANFNETGNGSGPYYIGQTSAVGIYPQGATPEGVMDLAGNVWEWTLSEWGEEQGSDPESAPRVLRGGSWGFSHRAVRGAARVRNLPRYQDHDRGFRVVGALPPP